MSDPIEQELAAAQRAYVKAVARRQAAVAKAREEVDGNGEPVWSAYRIAKAMTLGTRVTVPESTVRAILKAAGKPQQP